jgi:hypothetical protein
MRELITIEKGKYRALMESEHKLGLAALEIQRLREQLKEMTHKAYALLMSESA